MHAVGQLSFENVSNYGVKIALLLLNKNPNLINITENNGLTVLKIAVGHNNEQLIKLFLEIKPELANIIDDFGHTILHTCLLYTF